VGYNKEGILSSEINIDILESSPIEVSLSGESLPLDILISGEGITNLSSLYDVINTDKAVGKILKVDSNGNHVYVDDESGTDEKVKINSEDVLSGYLQDKIVAGSGISIVEGTGDGEGTLLITNTDKGSSIDLGGKEDVGVAASLDAQHLLDFNHSDITHTNRHSLDLVSGTNTGDQDLSGYQLISAKGQNNGYASLDAGGKIPANELPSTVMEFKGNWDANTNNPALIDGTGNAGDVYLVSVAGTQNLGSGSQTFALGDWILYNGTIWQKSINSNDVVSVNGQQGVVSLDTDNISEGATNKYDKTVSFTGGTNVTIGGTYPNFTITDNSINSTDLTPYWKSDGASTATGNWDLGAYTLKLGGIYDSTLTPHLSINPNIRILSDEFGATTLNWNTAILYTLSGKKSIEWDLSNMYSGSEESLSIDWFNRLLYKSDGTTIMFNWNELAFPTLVEDGFLKTSGGDGTLSVDTTSYEQALGNPSADDYVLSSKTDGTRSWVAAGSGGGASAFIDLTDAPSTYSGSAGDLIRVNSTNNGLEFWSADYLSSGGWYDTTQDMISISGFSNDSGFLTYYDSISYADSAGYAYSSDYAYSADYAYNADYAYYASSADYAYYWGSSAYPGDDWDGIHRALFNDSYGNLYWQEVAGDTTFTQWRDGTAFQPTGLCEFNDNEMSPTKYARYWNDTNSSLAEWWDGDNTLTIGGTEGLSYIEGESDVLATLNGTYAHFIDAGTSVPFYYQNTKSSTDTVIPIGVLSRKTTGAPAAGIGGSQDFYVTNSDGVQTLVAQIIVVLSDVTGANETAEIQLWQKQNGTMTKVFP
jgi:hypothetical protein